MLRKAFIVAGIIALACGIAVMAGRLTMASQRDKVITELFSSSGDVSSRVYTPGMTAALPAPVKRYFEYSLPENRPFVSYVRLRHGGQFTTKPGKKPVPIEGEEYFTAAKPGFVWFGKVPLITAKDMYIEGKGKLEVRLLSLIKLVNAEGKEVDQGELLRWLGEAAWFPTALLPSRNLRWEPIDDCSAGVVLSDKGLTVRGVFHFDGRGRLTKFVAKRYKGKSLETWTGCYRDYRDVAGMRIPYSVAVTWNLAAGDFTYAEFNVKTIEYDIPYKF